MSELKIFKNKEFGEVRTMLVNGEPYFVGKDVASVWVILTPETQFCNMLIVRTP